MNNFPPIIKELTDFSDEIKSSFAVNGYNEKIDNFKEIYKKALIIAGVDVNDLTLQEEKIMKAGHKIIELAVQSQTLINPEYHNIEHFANAVVASAFLCREEFKNDWKKPHYAVVLLTAMLGHDLYHDGSINTKDRSLEVESAKFVETVLVSHDVNMEDRDHIIEIIQATDVSRVSDYKKQYLELKNENKPIPPLLKMKVIAEESDIMYSMITTTGLELGEKLGKEWNYLIKNEDKNLSEQFKQMASNVATLKGRAGFLKYIVGDMASEAANSLGLNKAKDAELLVLEEIIKEGKDYKISSTELLELVNDKLSPKCKEISFNDRIEEIRKRNVDSKPSKGLNIG